MINSPGAYGCYSHVTARIAERGGGRSTSVDDARSQNWAGRAPDSPAQTLGAQ
jgi:hypothetical protein